MRFQSSTGVPVVDAQEDFLRARRAHVAARLVRRASLPRTLTDSARIPRGSARLEVIPLKAVVGTVKPTNTCDARFRPAADLVRAPAGSALPSPTGASRCHRSRSSTAPTATTSRTADIAYRSRVP
jgi:hypothetical protein